jgi:hypothetical protein
MSLTTTFAHYCAMGLVFSTNARTNTVRFKNMEPSGEAFLSVQLILRLSRILKSRLSSCTPCEWYFRIVLSERIPVRSALCQRRLGSSCPSGYYKFRVHIHRLSMTLALFSHLHCTSLTRWAERHLAILHTTIIIATCYPYNLHTSNMSGDDDIQKYVGQITQGWNQLSSGVVDQMKSTIQQMARIRLY